jgi:hypothetical protein
MDSIHDEEYTCRAGVLEDAEHPAAKKEEKQEIAECPATLTP